MKWYDDLGNTAVRDFGIDELFELSGFEWQE